MRPFQKDKVPCPAGDHTHAINAVQSAVTLAIEIGCGVGMHPIQYALKNPNTTVIALERTRERSRKCQSNSYAANLPNMIPIHADAINWISHFILPHQVDEYFILYPNPYPKKSQSNQRFVNMPFMSYLIKTLKKNGTITIASNIQSYCDEAEQRLIGHWGLKMLSRESISKITLPRTHFEKKYLERSELCQTLVFKK